MTMEEEGFAVGMDLGTTYCRVAVWKDNRVQVIEDAGGKRMMVSYVAFSRTQMFIGDAAESQAHMNITNTVFDSKRLIGRRFNDSCVQEDIKQWPFRLTSGPCDRPLVVVNYRGVEKQFTAEEICSMMLMKMKEKAESYLGATVKNVVITVPAYFNDSQRQATKDAGAIAGLNVIRLINEPTAAAFAYALDKKKEGTRNVLIFDLGGGTLDVSVMTIDGYTFKVKAVSGDTHLGGEDFDNRLVSHFVGELQMKHKIDISGNHKALWKLRSWCEKAKRNLSFRSHVTFKIEDLYEGNDFTFEITREIFEKLSVDLFEKCIDAVKRCLQDANMDASSVDDIVLVGGSTRIPMVQQSLRYLFDNKEVFKGISQDEEAVVCGAAVQAAILSYQLNLNLVVEDVAPLSLSVFDQEIIPRNATIPIKTMVTCTEDSDNRNAMFEVYEGEWDGSTYNNFLGVFWYSQLTQQPLKWVQWIRSEYHFHQITCEIPICFEVDVNGILNLSTKPTWGVRIAIEKGRLLDEEIEKMAKEAKEQQHQDYIESRNALEEDVSRIKKKVRNGRISSKDKEKIESTLASTTDWLQTNQLAEINEMESRKKKIKNFVNKKVKYANRRRKTARKIDKVSYETVDKKTELDIAVLEGEQTRCIDNNLQGKLTISRIPPAPRGNGEITVCFDIEEDSIITVSAVRKSSVTSITITNEKQRLSEDSSKKMIQDPEKCEDEENNNNGYELGAYGDADQAAILSGEEEGCEFSGMNNSITITNEKHIYPEKSSDKMIQYPEIHKVEDEENKKIAAHGLVDYGTSDQATILSGEGALCESNGMNNSITFIYPEEPSDKMIQYPQIHEVEDEENKKIAAHGLVDYGASDQATILSGEGALCESNGMNNSITITNEKYIYLEESIKNMIQDTVYEVEDEENKKKVAARDALKYFMKSLTDEEFASVIPVDQIYHSVGTTVEWIQNNQHAGISEIAKKKSELGEEVLNIGSTIKKSGHKGKKRRAALKVSKLLKIIGKSLYVAAEATGIL